MWCRGPWQEVVAGSLAVGSLAAATGLMDGLLWASPVICWTGEGGGGCDRLTESFCFFCVVGIEATGAVWVGGGREVCIRVIHVFVSGGSPLGSVGVGASGSDRGDGGRLRGGSFE